MDVGTELRNARELAGLSLEQVSQSTKIQVGKLEALENNDFEHLPEGVYLEGIVRTYALEVGLDGTTLVEQLYAQPFTPARHIDATSTYDLDTFAPEVAVAAPLTPAPVESTPRSVFEPTPERHIATRPRPGALRFALPLLALAGAVGLGWYLYETSRPFENQQTLDVPATSDEATQAGRAGETDAAAATPTGAAAADRAAASDAGADTPNATPTGRNTPAANDSNRADVISADRAPVPVTPQGREGREARQAATRPSTSARAESAVGPGAPVARQPDGGAGESVAPVTPVGPAVDGDLSGFWTVSTEVQSSSLRTYEGLQLGYRLQLDQSGNQITGNGLKVKENGRELPSSGRTPISVRGKIDGDRLELTFTEQGARRRTQGKFILHRDHDGTLRGRFSSTAARSSGLVEARRPEG